LSLSSSAVDFVNKIQSPLGAMIGLPSVVISNTAWAFKECFLGTCAVPIKLKIKKEIQNNIGDRIN
jgi:hypothetical protein